MPIELRSEGGIIRVTFYGTLTNRDLMMGAKDIGEIEAASEVVPHKLADLRPVERLEIDFPGVFALADARRRLTFANPFKTAILATDVVHFGFARMFQTLNDHPQIVIAIFDDEEQASAWLRRPDVSPPDRQLTSVGQRS